MTKQLLACAAVVALMTGAAFAQSVTETTTSRTTVVPPPPVESYSTKTERSTFGGAAVETEKTYRSDGGGMVQSQRERVVHPDGSSETTVKKEWTNAAPVPAPIPLPPAATSTTTTTTYR